MPGRRRGLSDTYNSFTPNNAAGDVAKFFVAGFDAGFWGGTGHSVNPKDTSTLNLSETWNWNANYAYNAILNPAVGYSNALGTGAGTPTGQNRFYDPYAAEFFKNSNAYGYSYTDLISGGGGINPAISLWDKATNANVQTVNIALYDLGETPASGFKTGNTGYVAPTGADYLPATTTSTNQLQFTFGFSVGSTLLAPSKDTPISFRFYAPGDAQAGADGFVALALPKGDWYYYQLTKNGGQWQLMPGNAGGQAGFFDIQNVPLTADGSPAWYQLLFGDVHSLSTYNIYATSAGNVFTSVVADHGVQVTTFGRRQCRPELRAGRRDDLRPRHVQRPDRRQPGRLGANQSVHTGHAAARHPAAAGAPGAARRRAQRHELRGGAGPQQPEAGRARLRPQYGGRRQLAAAGTDRPDRAQRHRTRELDHDADRHPGELSGRLDDGAVGAVRQRHLQRLPAAVLPHDFDLDREVYADSQIATFTVNLDTLALGTTAGGTALALSAGGSNTQGNWIELFEHGLDHAQRHAGGLHDRRQRQHAEA